MLRKIIAFILCILMVSFPIMSKGQTVTSTVGTYSFVEKGEPTPFSGILFDDVAIAIILTDKETSEKEFQLKLDYEIEKVRSHYELENNNLKIDLEFAKKEHSAVLEIKNKQIEETTKIAMGGTDWTWLWIGLGVVAGVLVGVGSVVMYEKLK